MSFSSPFMLREFSVTSYLFCIFFIIEILIINIKCVSCF